MIFSRENPKIVKQICKDSDILPCGIHCLGLVITREMHLAAQTCRDQTGVLGIQSRYEKREIIVVVLTVVFTCGKNTSVITVAHHPCPRPLPTAVTQPFSVANRNETSTKVTLPCEITAKIVHILIHSLRFYQGFLFCLVQRLSISEVG